MKVINAFCFICLFIFSGCSEETKVFMDMNKNYYPPDEIIKKVEYFIQKKYYYEAYESLIDAGIIYAKEGNKEGIHRSNMLLCKIYSTKETDNTPKNPFHNPYYNPELAKVACNKADIKMNQE